VRGVSDAVVQRFQHICSTVKDGAVQQTAAVKAALRRQLAMRSVADLRGSPEAAAFLVPVLRAANGAALEVCTDLSSPAADGFRHTLERLDDIAEYLLHVCPEEMRQSFMLPGGEAAVPMCSICFAEPEAHELQGCRCSLPFRICSACVDLMQMWGLCPQCRSSFRGIVPASEGGGQACQDEHADEPLQYL